MNYLDDIAETVRAFAGDEYNDYAGIELYRQYAVLVLVKGHATTMEDVHNAWAAWALTFRPDSNCIIPFSDLTANYQQQDESYVGAIHSTTDYLERTGWLKDEGR